MRYTKAQVTEALRTLAKSQKNTLNALDIAARRTTYDRGVQKSRPTTDAERAEWLKRALSWVDGIDVEAMNAERVVRAYVGQELDAIAARQRIDEAEGRAQREERDRIGR